MGIKISFFSLLILFLTASCDEKRVFDQYKSVENAWHKDSVVTFDLPQLDKTKNYNLFVNIRNNNDFPYNNLFLIVSLGQPNKKVLIDTLEYQMANPDGSLLGEGFSDVKLSKLSYKPNFNFNLKGKYTVKIQHASRQTGKIAGDKTLNGVTEVGFRIESK